MPPTASAIQAGPAIRYGRDLRPLFKLDATTTFINHGSFGLTPLAVLAAQETLRAEMERQPVQFLSRATLQPRLRAAAGQLAAFLGAAGEDLVFVDNATTGVNAVLRSFILRPGDEVLITDHTYPAVRNAVRFACGRAGARMVEARLPFPPESPDRIAAAVKAALTDRTRLAVFDLVSSAIAMPAAAPKGCALLWATKEAQQNLHPTVISHGFEQGFANEFDWTGTRDPTAWLAVPAALDFYRSRGDGALRDRNHDLAVAAAGLLAERWGTEAGAPPR